MIVTQSYHVDYYSTKHGEGIQSLPRQRKSRAIDRRVGSPRGKSARTEFEMLRQPGGTLTSSSSTGHIVFIKAFSSAMLHHCVREAAAC